MLRIVAIWVFATGCDWAFQLHTIDDANPVALGDGGPDAPPDAPIVVDECTQPNQQVTLPLLRDTYLDSGGAAHGRETILRVSAQDSIVLAFATGIQSYSQIKLHLARRISARECSSSNTCALCPHTLGGLQAYWIRTDWDEVAATGTLRQPPATHWQPTDRSQGVVDNATYDGGDTLDTNLVLFTNDLPAAWSGTQLGIVLTSIAGAADATFTSREVDASCGPVVEAPTASATCR